MACEVGPICSDGVVAEDEECEDAIWKTGRRQLGCQLEDPPHSCGDGTLDPGEACDDGNTIGSDAAQHVPIRRRREHSRDAEGAFSRVRTKRGR